METIKPFLQCRAPGSIAGDLSSALMSYYFIDLPQNREPAAKRSSDSPNKETALPQPCISLRRAHQEKLGKNYFL